MSWSGCTVEACCTIDCDAVPGGLHAVMSPNASGELVAERICGHLVTLAMLLLSCKRALSDFTCGRKPHHITSMADASTYSKPTGRVPDA